MMMVVAVVVVVTAAERMSFLEKGVVILWIPTSWLFPYGQAVSLSLVKEETLMLDDEMPPML